jgi:hypothetical protein
MTQVQHQLTPEQINTIQGVNTPLQEYKYWS